MKVLTMHLMFQGTFLKMNMTNQLQWKRKYDAQTCLKMIKSEILSNNRKKYNFVFFLVQFDIFNKYLNLS